MPLAFFLEIAVAVEMLARLDKLLRNTMWLELPLNAAFLRGRL